MKALNPIGVELRTNPPKITAARALQSVFEAALTIAKLTDGGHISSPLLNYQ